MSILDEANIPKSIQEYCYVAETGAIFTPIFDDNGILIKTGKALFDEVTAANSF